MPIERFAARLMAMDDRAWARHANPWSVWTRFATLPFLLLAGGAGSGSAPGSWCRWVC
jgi:hypothetical protein